MPAVQELGQDAAQAKAEGKAEARAPGGVQKGDVDRGNVWKYMGVSINGGTSKIDDLKWTIPLKWMIWGCPYFRKPTYGNIRKPVEPVGTRLHADRSTENYVGCAPFGSIWYTAKLQPVHYLPPPLVHYLPPP